MGSVGGGGLGGGLLSDRDDARMGGGPSSEGARKGYYSYERDRWIGDPEESFSAAVAPVAKPVSRIEMYLDETPALQPQIDYSAAAAANKAAAERARTMGATMGGGPSYDPLRPDSSTPSWAEEVNSEMTASSNPLTVTNIIRTNEGYKEPVWKPEFSKWSAAKKADWMAGFDKTLGAHSRWSEEMRRLRENELGETINTMMAKHVDRWYADNEMDGPEYNSVRDVIRHGIATNKFGLTKMTGYETFKSGQEWSDYKNNYAAAKFARTLKPGQNFDDEWTAAVIQEKMNPGSTGLTIDFKAGTEDDPTATEALEGWVRSFMDKLSGLQSGGMITEAEQGGG